MDKQRLTTLITQPERLQEKDFSELSTLKKEYPYFQAISPLLTLGSKTYAPQTEKENLQTAAIYALDRKHLKEILSKSYTFNEGNEQLYQSEPNGQKAKKEISEKSQSDLDFKNKVVADPTETAKKKTAASSPFRIETTPAKSSSHLPDSFFDELFRDMEALKAEKENYQETLKKYESEKPNTASKSNENKAVKKQRAKKATAAVSAKSKTTSKSPRKTSTASPKNASSPNKTPAAKSKGTSKKGAATKAKKSTQVNSKKTKTDEHDIIEELSSRKELKINDAHKKEQLNIINSFIENEPVLTKRLSTDSQSNKQEAEDLSANSTNLSDDVVSETLAKLMIKQGRKQKAVDIYKKLIWKFPQKKTYFVEIIEELKKES